MIIGVYNNRTGRLPRNSPRNSPCPRNSRVPGIPIVPEVPSVSTELPFQVPFFKFISALLCLSPASTLTPSRADEGPGHRFPPSAHYPSGPPTFSVG